MKKILIALITAFILLMTVASSTAVINRQGLNVHSIQQTTEQVFTVYTGGEDGLVQENVKVRAYIMELGILATSDGPFDVGTSKHKSTLIFELPEDTPSGCYTVRFSISSDDVKRIKHRFICV